MSATLKILAASVALAGAAYAAPPSMNVGYGDLDISQAASGDVLLGRIQTAARKVCGKRNNYSPAHPHGISECRRETIASAVRRMAIPSLTAAWTGAEIKLAAK